MKAQQFNISTLFHSMLVEVFLCVCLGFFFLCLCYHSEFCEEKPRVLKDL